MCMGMGMCECAWACTCSYHRARRGGGGAAGGGRHGCCGEGGGSGDSGDSGAAGGGQDGCCRGGAAGGGCKGIRPTIDARTDGIARWRAFFHSGALQIRLGEYWPSDDSALQWACVWVAHLQLDGYDCRISSSL